jgi:hypothetical protein
MRFYRIEITDPNGVAAPIIFTSWNERAYFPGSLFGPSTDFGALNVIFDLQTVPFSTPRGYSMVEIWGIPLSTISGSSNLNNRNITIYAGFKPGLPLATQASRYQSGPIIQGFILQAFGNWIGTQMTLNLVVSPGIKGPTSTTQATSTQSTTIAPVAPPIGSLSVPINGRFYMPAGMPVSTAIRNFLEAALPTFTVASININPDFTQSHEIGGVFLTMTQFNQWIASFSRNVVGGNYSGINIRVEQGNRIVVDDNSPPSQLIKISYLDLIGQPTWIEPFKIQIKCPMRADLQVNYTIELPQGYYSILPNQPSGPRLFPERSRSVQQGKYTITELRHVGNFRQADASSWVSVVTCAFLPSGTQQ